jgi:hypothetical protein
MFRDLTILLDRSNADLKIRNALRTKKWLGYGGPRILIVSEDGRISKSQIFPFHYYSNKFRDRWGVEFRQIEIADIDAKSDRIPENADLIFFQSWFKDGADELIRLIHCLKRQNPNAKVVFFDAYAPLDLRFAEALNPLVDTYVKKHVFRDRSRYGATTQGDTNLVEYYERLYELPASRETLFHIPQNFLSKLFVGPSFFTSREMLPAIHSNQTPLSQKKNFGVHARLGAKGLPWYQAMREHALLACESFNSEGVVTSESVSNHRYMRELAQSRICFSPFGYGEVCWRDYEAIMCGTLLLKPDMSHVQTEPDIFIPYETYVPLAWDFSDLSEKVDYYLANEAARQRIVEQSYATLHTYTNNDAFLNQFEVIVSQGS